MVYNQEVTCQSEQVRGTKSRPDAQKRLSSHLTQPQETGGVSGPGPRPGLVALAVLTQAEVSGEINLTVYYSSLIDN